MRRRGASAAAALLALALVAGGCSDEKPGLGLPSPAGQTPPPESPPPAAESAPGSAAAALARLCTEIEVAEDDEPVGRITPEVAEVADQVESVRGFGFEEEVGAEPVSAAEMSRRVSEAFSDQYPAAFYDRRSLAWTTIGVVPPGTDLREELLQLGEGGIVGYYDPATGALVYIASGDLGLTEAFTLAHELTHAIDDQRFDLSRLDPLAESCRDESFQAALGAVEGSAQFFGTLVLQRFPVPPTAGDLDGADLGVLREVPPFLVDQQLWPYNYGQAFMIALERRGGLDEVDRALRRFPVSTEQVMHPERYPNDLPTPLDIGPLSGWRDLDVMEVGEQWFRAMLKLRLDIPTAGAAAAGWDGGIYRAYRQGEDVAVAIRTVWDSARDADEFRRAIELWVDERDQDGIVRQGGDEVWVFFATNEVALAAVSTLS